MARTLARPRRRDAIAVLFNVVPPFELCLRLSTLVPHRPGVNGVTQTKRCQLSRAEGHIVRYFRPCGAHSGPGRRELGGSGRIRGLPSRTRGPRREVETGRHWRPPDAPSARRRNHPHHGDPAQVEPIDPAIGPLEELRGLTGLAAATDGERERIGGRLQHERIPGRVGNDAHEVRAAGLRSGRPRRTRPPDTPPAAPARLAARGPAEQQAPGSQPWRRGAPAGPRRRGLGRACRPARSR